MICTFLQIDLVLTLKRPFSNPKKRQNYGITISSIFMVIYGIVIHLTWHIQSEILLHIIFVGIRVAFFLSAIISFSVAIHAYCKSGLSKQFRRLLIVRNISFCILNTIQ